MIHNQDKKDHILTITTKKVSWYVSVMQQILYMYNKVINFEIVSKGN